MWHRIHNGKKYVYVLIPTKDAIPGDPSWVSDKSYSYLGKTPGTPEWEKVSQLREARAQQEKS